MGADSVLYRPILRSGAVIGYLWCDAESAGFWPRAGSEVDDAVCEFWMRWLSTAREYGLSPWEALTSWDPRTEFPLDATPAPGAPNELAGMDDLYALAEARVPPTPYDDDTRVAVRHYQVIRGDRYLGRLWASVDDAAAGFLESPDLPADDPAATVWPRRLAESHASGLTASQALHALRGLPDDGSAGHLVDPLGQSYLRDLRR